MRLVPLLLVSLALIATGCAKKEDDGGATTTPTGGTTTSTTKATTSTPPTGNSTTPPTSMPTPTELCSKSKDFQGNTPAPGTQPPAITKEACGTPPATAKSISANVTWTAGQPVIVQQSVALKLLGPDGTAVGSCAGPAAGQAPAAIPPCLIEGSVTAGEYVLQYEGTGNLKATVVVTVV